MIQKRISRMGRFEGQLAVVTASTSGIGFAIAERLASEGATIVISSRKETHVKEAETKLKDQSFQVKGVVCNVNNTDALKNLVREAVSFGNRSIDILVSNAGISPTLSSLSKTPESVIDAILNVNVKSAILLVQTALPYLSGSARIVFNASIAAFTTSNPVLMVPGMYSVSKTALLGITKVFANELGKRGIRVNAIAPGIVQTKFSGAIFENSEASSVLMNNTPLNRLPGVEEIASVVAFLVSDDASFISGETIVISGGLQSRL